jgi:hypothetical protein
LLSVLNVTMLDVVMLNAAATNSTAMEFVQAKDEHTLSVIMLGKVILSILHAKCQNTGCSYAECLNAKLGCTEHL